MSKYAHMWWCQDYECNCTEPQIIEDGWNMLYPKFCRVIDSGPFYSNATDSETKDQWRWLLEAARRHKVKNLDELLTQHSERG